MKGLSDFDFLRALYTAVSFSPFVLLSKLPVVKEATTSRRLALHTMVEVQFSCVDSKKSLISNKKSFQALCYPMMQGGEKRLIVEKDCWCLLVDMAVHGHARFKPGMTRLLSKWKALLEDVDDTELEQPPTVYDKRGWAKELSINVKLAKEKQRFDLLFSNALVAVASTKREKLSALPCSDPKWIEDELNWVLANPVEISAAGGGPGGAGDGRRKSGRQTKEPSRGTGGAGSSESKASKKRARKKGVRGTKKRKVSKSGSHVTSNSDDIDCGCDSDDSDCDCHVKDTLDFYAGLDDVKPVFSLPIPGEVAAPEVRLRFSLTPASLTVMFIY